MKRTFKLVIATLTFMNSFFLNFNVEDFENYNHETFSVKFEGAFSNYTDSFDCIEASKVNDKSLIRVILDTPEEIDELDYVKPSKTSTISEVQKSLSDYRKNVKNIIYANNIETIKVLNDNSSLEIDWKPSTISNLLTCEMETSKINEKFINALEDSCYAIENIDSIYISECSSNNELDYSMDTVYEYTNLANAVNSNSFTGRGINFGIIDGGILNLSKYSGNMSNDNDYTGRNVYFKDKNASYSDHSDHVAMLSVGNNGIAPGTNIYSTTYHDSFESNMEWMIKNGVNIINTSYGVYSDSNNGAYTSDAKLADQFIREYFITLVGSAGNLRDSNPNNEISSPKTAYNYITVGNTSSSKNIVSSNSSYAEKSSYGGSKPNIVAPGFTKTNSYEGIYYDGTSFSAPITAGALALLMEEFPYLAAFPELCISILTSSASPMSSSYNTISGDDYYHSSGLHNKFGSGMLNYEKMRESANNYLSISRLKGKSSGVIDKTLDFCVPSGKRIRASLAWLATGGNDSFTDYDLLLYRVNPDNTTTLVKNITGMTNNVEFLDYEVKSGGKFRLAIYQVETNQQTDYIGLSYVTIDNSIGGSKSGGNEYGDLSQSSIQISTTDYNYSGIYNFSESSSVINLGNGIIVNTKRLRTAIIDGYLVMSAKRNNAGTAYLEYDLNQFVNGINYPLALWSDDESLIKDSYIALEYFDSSGTWVKAKEFYAKEMGQNKDSLINYSTKFDSFTSKIRFIVKTNAVANENNRGRVVIGRVEFLT